MEGATVALRPLEPAGDAEGAVTGRHGEAGFIDLAAGRYSYRVHAVGQAELASADSVRLNAGEWKDLTVRLAASSLAISGRVLNRQGDAVAGIEISAVHHRFASSVREAGAGDRPPRATRSRDDGSFTIRGLSAGEYDVRTSATDRYPSVQAVVQAGADAVDLILPKGLRVHGIVRNTRGEPLTRVRVGPGPPRNRFAYSDDQGLYALSLEHRPDEQLPILRFSLEGYEEERLVLAAGGVEGGGELRLDAELRAVEETTAVSGVVQTERGEPVAGATVLLSAQPGPRYQTLSDADGNFSLEHVKIGAGYQLGVIAPDPYRDYLRSDVGIRDDGISFEIVLESLSTGRLTGRMVDAEGNPLAGFRLWLASGAAVRSAVPVTSDERGYFELEEAPAGSLSFDTRASPRHRVSGLTLRAGGESEVHLVLDAGDQVMSGNVLDDRGDPVAGAEVSLSWSHTSGETRSTSRRSTRTDPSGSFRFTRLGPDEHLLDVRATGYRPVQEYHDVGRYAPELEVRVEPNAP